MSAQSAIKYVIEARIDIDGQVDKPDIIGALFGQTEGLFSAELDLRELQRTGRIGRIEINVSSQENKTVGRIIVPTNLDRSTTALLAAVIESVDRVGPYQSKVTIEKIEDARVEKRKRITERARTILYEWEKQKLPTDDVVMKEIGESLLKAKIIDYGPESLPAGPEVESNEELMIVEGRADVINLLKYGYKNVIAVEGVKIPKTIQELTHRKKKVVAFLDGDRGGDMILRELLQSYKIDFIARAPYGKEVEELTSKEIAEGLEKVLPPEEASRSIRPVQAEKKQEEVPEAVRNTISQIEGTLTAVLFSQESAEIGRIPVSELASKLKDFSGVKYVLFDGVSTQRLVDVASTLNTEVYLIGIRTGDITKRNNNVHLLTLGDIS